MGILNVTPDSFSDGGTCAGVEAGVARARAMVAEGADIIDVGGESTRPGALPVPAREQIGRVRDVIQAIRAAVPGHVRISIDTTRARVAEAALAAGADWINDTSAACDDPSMLHLAASRAVPLILMHRRGTPATMQEDPRYVDVCLEVKRFLEQRVDTALRAGMRRENLMLDPGIGFGKRSRHNLALLSGLEQLACLGFPLLLGTSRKRFMGRICGAPGPGELAPATCATTALGVMAGVEIFRVHDVAANRQAADVAWAIKQAGSPGGADPEPGRACQSQASATRASHRATRSL